MRKILVLAFIFLSIISFSNTVGAVDIGVDAGVGTVTPPSGGGGGSIIPPEPIPELNITDLIPERSYEDIVLKFSTNTPAQCSVSWGEDPIANTNSITEPDFSKSYHIFTATPLSLGRSYAFDIYCANQSGKNKSLRQVFSTLSLPSDVSGFSARGYETSIELKWTNPTDTEFAGVKIVRSEKAYPKNISDGTLVYEGKGSIYLDTGLESDVTYFYTVFAYNTGGLYSSGAMIFATTIKTQIPQPPVNPPENPTNPQGQPSDINQPTTTPSEGTGQQGGGTNQQPGQITSPGEGSPGQIEEPTQTLPIEEQKLLYEETKDVNDFVLPVFNFEQNSSEMNIDQNTVTGITEEDIVISIPEDQVPNDVTKMILILYGGGDGLARNNPLTFRTITVEASSYTFQYDPVGKRYFVKIPYFEKAGDYPFVVDFFDKDNNLLREVSGKLAIKSPVSREIKKAAVNNKWLILLVLLLVMVLLKYHLDKRKNKPKKGLDRKTK